MCHLEARLQIAHRDEAELAGGDCVAAAGDDPRPEPPERRRAGGPVREGEEGVAGAALAVASDRANVRDGLPFGADQLLGLARAGAERVEDRPIWLLRRVGEVPVEAVQ